MKRIVGGLLALLLCDAALAGSVDQATIVNASADGNAYYFTVAPTINNSPACSQVNNQFDIVSMQGGNEVMIALLLMAQAQGRKIFVQGSGTCYNGRETVAWIVVY